MSHHFSNKKIFWFLVLFIFFQINGHATAQTSPVSETISITAQVGSDPVAPAGGGSGSIRIPRTSVQFSGIAYPNGVVTLLEGGAVKTTVVADGLGNFSITLAETPKNPVVYTLFAVDIHGNRSLLLNYPVAVYEGYLTHLSGIKFAPTIVLDKAEVKVGDYLSLSGQNAPNQKLEVVLEGKDRLLFTLLGSNDGSYKAVLPMRGLTPGEYYASIRYTGDTRMSKLVRFTVGTANILSADTAYTIPGDCNSDMVINLIDFSVLAFWYGKSSPPLCVDTNHDKKIDLRDFSILAFWWTG